MIPVSRRLSDVETFGPADSDHSISAHYFHPCFHKVTLVSESEGLNKTIEVLTITFLMLLKTGNRLPYSCRRHVQHAGKITTGTVDQFDRASWTRPDRSRFCADMCGLSHLRLHDQNSRRRRAVLSQLAISSITSHTRLLRHPLGWLFNVKTA